MVCENDSYGPLNRLVYCRECGEAKQKKEDKIKLKIKASGLYPPHQIWGGGHTTETDPMRKGWRACYSGSNKRVLLVGKKDVEGCFSMVPMEKDLSLAFYLETPEYVNKNINNEEYTDASYEVVPDVPGWGLKAIEILKKEMRSLGYNEEEIPQ